MEMCVASSYRASLATPESRYTSDTYINVIQKETYFRLHKKDRKRIQ